MKTIQKLILGLMISISLCNCKKENIDDTILNKYIPLSDTIMEFNKVELIDSTIYKFPYTKISPYYEYWTYNDTTAGLYPFDFSQDANYGSVSIKKGNMKYINSGVYGGYRTTIYSDNWTHQTITDTILTYDFQIKFKLNKFVTNISDFNMNKIHILFGISKYGNAPRIDITLPTLFNNSIKLDNGWYVYKSKVKLINPKITNTTSMFFMVYLTINENDIFPNFELFIDNFIFKLSK